MASFMVRSVFERRQEMKGKKAKWPWLDQESKQGDHVCHKDEKSIDGDLQWEIIDQLERPLKVRIAYTVATKWTHGNGTFQLR